MSIKNGGNTPAYNLVFHHIIFYDDIVQKFYDTLIQGTDQTFFQVIWPQKEISNFIKMQGELKFHGNAADLFEEDISRLYFLFTIEYADIENKKHHTIEKILFTSADDKKVNIMTVPIESD